MHRYARGAALVPGHDIGVTIARFGMSPLGRSALTAEADALSASLGGNPAA
jgi:hypothetical protein